jgi:hypothetical protein
LELSGPWNHHEVPRRRSVYRQLARCDSRTDSAVCAETPILLGSEAKDFVQSLEVRLRVQLPEQFTEPPANVIHVRGTLPGFGCTGNIARPRQRVRSNVAAR